MSPRFHQETGNVTLRGLTATPATQVHSSALRALREGVLVSSVTNGHTGSGDKYPLWEYSECGGVWRSALECPGAAVSTLSVTFLIS